MTKHIRIENADTAPYKAQVQVQHKNPATGEWENAGDPVALSHPTAMVTDYLTSTRRLVVEELPADAA
ncbi:hypothetical protein [Acidovorax cavernicola]|uniref:Uncharacterized protein n=1 Tax=Acidovorax cavernicola TaxID=1675792 RepID=A0A9X8D4R4_9BURK|nr:hypothetical protein [Acidovorax cavernicola]RIX79129.1 hypothetical protein D3H34_15425 [Acidovorax cavernicola]